MVFSTFTFLFAFFPLVFLLYYVIPNRKYRNTILLLFSLVFYSWGEPKFILLMLATSLVAYLSGLWMDHLDKKGQLGMKKTVMIATIALLLSSLFIFKYLNFVVENLNNLLPGTVSLAKIVLPIGISFYTFQILSYVVDLYRKKIAVQKSYFDLTLYVAFFPQLIAGPIVRYETVEDEILNRKETLEDVVCGFRRFIIGLAKKVIIANSTGAIATMIYTGGTDRYNSVFYWLAAIAYALQIYYDFSGYSDMAIGLGRMFGFRFLENFNYPYISTSITEFWRRWHISLSSWFRDYVYIPLGGNRVKKSRWILNILVVWGLTGFWHGAQWNFLFWGLYYAVLLLLEKLFLQKWLEKMPVFVRWLYTMVLVLIGWVLFNLTDVSQMLDAIRHMFSFDFSEFSRGILHNLDIAYAAVYIPLGILCMFPWKNILSKWKLPDMVVNAVMLLLAGGCVIYILGSTYNPFIYFRF